MTAALHSLLDNANDLKRLPRTGWLLAGIRQPESVADHAYATTLLAMLLADAINADYASAGLTAPLDVGRVLRIALLHDLAESQLTDLPKRSADLLGSDVKHTAEQDAMQRLLSEIEGAASYLSLWEEYEDAATPEARVVKDADKLEMVHQAWRYAEIGHSHLDEFWHGHRWYYTISAQLFETLARAS
jgi:putative hydrolase of HD superfamily